MTDVWGARVRDWADVQQHQVRNSWQAVIDELPPLAGRRLLDVGCGAGGFAALALGAGAEVSGFDASPGMIEEARRRVPGVDFRVGDMERLSYPDAAFDVVTGFNSFQFAGSTARALREAARVTRPGGHLSVMVWGPDERCLATVYQAAVRALLPPAASAPHTPGLSEPGELERVLEEAGVRPGPRRVVACPWRYADDEELLRGVLSAGSGVRAIAATSEAVVCDVALRACARFRQADGSYVIENEFHHVISRV